jgi:hypothetical protein
MGLEEALIGYRIKATVAEGVAAQQAPSSKNQPAKYAVLGDRLRGV